MAEVVPAPGLFAWRRDEARITRAVTSRVGGASLREYAELNLGSRVADDAARVARNRATLAAALGVEPDRVLFLHQVHGAEVVHARDAMTDEPMADAWVSTTPGLALAVLAADCVPVLLADPDAGVIGAAHVGRPGMVAGTVSALVTRMRELGAHTIDAVVGPAVCGRCYEVPQAMHDEVVAQVPAAHAVSRTGTAALDIAAGVLSQLAGLDVPAQRVLGCTRESADLYSYRRDGVTGRHAGVIVLRDPAAEPSPAGRR